jgi:hypothetical protein
LSIDMPYGFVASGSRLGTRHAAGGCRTHVRTVSGGEASPNGLCTVVARERPSTDRRDVRPFFKRVRRASPLDNALSAFAVWRGQRLSPCLTHAYIRLRLSIRCHRTRHIFLLLHGLLLRGLLLRGLLLRGLSGRSTSLMMGGRPPRFRSPFVSLIPVCHKMAHPQPPSFEST